MSDRSHIEWTDATWNPVTGCTKVSAGCDNCYAETLAERFRGTPGHYYEGGFDMQLRPEKLDQPLRWRRPRRIFVNSMSDLFHDSVPDDYIANVFAVMARAEQHTFQVLTKRHARMRSLLSSLLFRRRMYDYLVSIDYEWINANPLAWPLPNVWLGVSAENQQWADIRIPALLDTPAAVRFVSAEPLIGWLELTNDLLFRPTPCPNGCGCSRPEDADGNDCACDGPCCYSYEWNDRKPDLDWVIVGGESGHDARPMHPDWARGLRDQCKDAGVAFLFKQRGEWTWNEPGQFRLPTEPFTGRVAVMHGAGMTAMTKGNPFNPFERGHPNWTTRIERVGKKAAGRELDGRTWDEYPT